MGCFPVGLFSYQWTCKGRITFSMRHTLMLYRIRTENETDTVWPVTNYRTWCESVHTCSSTMRQTCSLDQRGFPGIFTSAPDPTGQSAILHRLRWAKTSPWMWIALSTQCGSHPEAIQTQEASGEMLQPQGVRSEPAEDWIAHINSCRKKCG